MGVVGETSRDDQQQDDDPLALPADLVAKASRELGESPTVRTSSIASLRERVEELPPEERPHRSDDEYLLAFLRPQKFRVDIALEKLKAYTAFKNERRDALKNMKAEDFRDFIRVGMLKPLTLRDQDGRHVIYVCPPKLLELKDPDIVFKWFIFYWEQVGMLFDPYVQVNGVVIVDELQGFTLDKILRITQGPLQRVPKTILNLIAKAMPFRVKTILVVNEPVYFDIILAFARTFVPSKIFQRMKFLGRGKKALETLHEDVTPQCLPPDLGGTLVQTPEDLMKLVDVPDKFRVVV